MANNNHFELTLDTIAPVGSVTRGTNEFINKNVDLTVNTGDATYFYAWFTAADAEVTERPAGLEARVVADDLPLHTEFTAEGTYKYHVVLMDDVGNESEIYHTEAMMYETTAPKIDESIENTYIKSAAGRKDITKDLDNTVTVSAADQGTVQSGIAKYIIEGDCLAATVESATGENIAISFKNTEEDGNKTIKVTVVDEAGNSTSYDKLTIKLDRHAATAVLSLEKDGEHEALLPEWINYRAFSACIDCSDADVVGYKLWGDVKDHTTKPADYTVVTLGTDPIHVNGLEFTAGDGLKTVNIEIIDEAGNVWPNANTSEADREKAKATVKVDTVAPTASLSVETSAANNWISEVDGFNEATITATVVNTGNEGEKSDIKSYSLKVNGAEKRDTIAESYILTSADGMVEGENTITLTVEDVAGNTVTSEAVIVRLDKTAPAFEVADLTRETFGEWFNEEFDARVTASSDLLADGAHNGAGIYEYVSWVSTNAAEEVAPATAADTLWTAAAQDIKKENIDFSKLAQGTNYLHVIAIDKVGNMTQVIKPFKYDDIAPANLEVKFIDGVNTEIKDGKVIQIYASRNAKISITDIEAGSGNTWMQITGDCEESSEDWIAFSAEKAVTLTGDDGYKTVSVKVRDHAGNVSTSASDICELDLTAPSATITLVEKDSEAAKASPSNVAEFDVLVEYNDDPVEDKPMYKVYGTNFNGGMTEYADFVKEEGKNYARVHCTAIDDGNVNVYVAVKDDAGHEYISSTPVTWEYDTKPIEVFVTERDFSRISKVHVLREKSDKFCDEVHFSFYAVNDKQAATNEYYQAYKVCAYADQAAAIAGTHNDSAIPTDAGSINMEASGLHQTDIISAMIRGSDFEKALGGTGNPATQGEGFDGAHIVVVYMQDAGGTWSNAAEFEITAD